MRSKSLTFLLLIVFAAFFISQCHGENEDETAEEKRDGEEEGGHAQLHQQGEQCPAGDSPTQKCSRSSTYCGTGFYCKLFQRNSGNNMRFCCRRSRRRGGRVNGKSQRYSEKMQKAKQKKQKQKDKLRRLKTQREQGHIDDEQYRKKKQKYKQKKDNQKLKARKNKRKLNNGHQQMW
ncbi:hypothetical protein niasHS_012091 [Heterodera schachtii]|uniref:Uncharacterized protein n=1 Tax=Heterodera schachtii TaxID=97005 RepID=A0ABD2IDI7_HETSC